MVFKFDADPATGHEVPTGVEVTGNAQATAGGAGEQGLTVKARTIGAELAKMKDQIVVKSATAREEVHVSTNAKPGEQPMHASGDRLDVDPVAGLAVLQGTGVTVSGNGATMFGRKVTLSQADGSVFVDGGGMLTSLRDEDPAHITTSVATWDKSMRFENATGKATCLGNATATMTVGETEKNTAHAETIVLSFTPAPAPGTPNKAGTRELLKAEAIGEPGIDGKPPRSATLERREFSMVNGEQHLDKLLYLEGQKIEADQPHKTLDVPVPGKLLVDDRSPDATPAKAPAPAAPPPAAADPAAPPAQPTGPMVPVGGFTSSKGTSLFTWAGSLHLDMTAGKAELKRDVQLTHQPLPAPGQPTPAQTTVDCDQLTATLLTAKPASGGNGSLSDLSATLSKVEASGNVVAKSEGRQLTADTITFDTIRQSMEAAGGNGPTPADLTLVTYIDPARPAPVRARKVVWDQRAGEIRIIEPAPTTIGQ
ncbi:MAG: hypothetical protein QM783_14955 [Phycisphaerales bacterium]